MADPATAASVVSVIVGVVTLGSVFLKTGGIMARIEHLSGNLNRIATDLAEHKKDDTAFHMQAGERLAALETKVEA